MNQSILNEVVAEYRSGMSAGEMAVVFHEDVINDLIRHGYVDTQLNFTIKFAGLLYDMSNPVEV